MWIVRLTPSEAAISAGASVSIQTIPSDSAIDLLSHPAGDWKWGTVEKLLNAGLLTWVEVDYIPTEPANRARAIIERMGR